MSLTIQHIHLADPADVDGALIYEGDALIAVLSQLSLERGARAGRWFLEYEFGAAFDGHEDFGDLASACAWIERRLAGQKSRQPGVRNRL